MAISREEKRLRWRDECIEHRERCSAAISDEDFKTDFERRWDEEFKAGRSRWVMTSTGLRLRADVEADRAKRA